MGNDVGINTRYFGKICAKHPELNGERMFSTKHCVQCKRDRVRKYYQSELGKLIISNYKSEWHQKQLTNPDYIAKRNATNSARKASIQHRMPAWADKDKIFEIYQKAKELGLTVDHIIPLHGKSVSGLHVHNNLQLLPGPENFGKGNRYELG